MEGAHVFSILKLARTPSQAVFLSHACTPFRVPRYRLLHLYDAHTDYIGTNPPTHPPTPPTISPNTAPVIAVTTTTTTTTAGTTCETGFMDLDPETQLHPDPNVEFSEATGKVTPDMAEFKISVMYSLFEADGSSASRISTLEASLARYCVCVCRGEGMPRIPPGRTGTLMARTHTVGGGPLWCLGRPGRCFRLQ